MGLTARQLIASVIAMGVCVPLYLWGQKYINEEIVSWLIILVATPCAGFGFFKFNGLPFEKFITVIFKHVFLYPTKRKFKISNCFREWQDITIAADEAKKGMNTKKAKKISYQASLERSVLIEEAEALGETIEADNLDEKLLTVRKGDKTPKKPKKEKKPKIKKPTRDEQLKQQSLEIKEKLSADPHYLLTKRERNILLQWAKRLEQLRLNQIKQKKKAAHKKNKKMEKRRHLSTTIPRSTQQSIPYIADFEEGLIEVEPNKYSKAYRIKDINYLVSKEDEQVGIFCKYGEFINYFSEEMHIAVIIDNRVVSMNEQEQKVFYALKSDGYNKHRKEYNRILKRQIIAGRNDIQQTKYITVTIDCDSPYEALLRFHKIDAEVITNLKKIGSDGEVLTTDERLMLLHDKFRKGHEGEFQVDYNFLKEQGISSKDYVAPASMCFEKKHFLIEDEYYRCLFLNNLPASLTDEFLAEMVDCEFPLITSLIIQPVAQDKGLRLVKKQLTGMEANKIEAEKKAVRAGYSPETISHDLKQSLGQAEELLDDMMNKNQKMFFVTISLMVNGRTLDELEDNVKILSSKARKYTCQLQRFDWQQEEAFKLTLPMGYSPKHLSVERALTTESTSIFIPFSSQELFQSGGFYYGLNQISRNLILCNRTAMKTPSGFILGSSGSGKSFATKREILNVMLNDDKTGVLVIDPENEYGDFARAFGGTVIKISADTSNYISPMDMGPDYGLDEEDDSETTPIEIKKSKALKKKSDYLMSIIERMISTGASADSSSITPQQKTIVDRCVSRCYKNYLEHDFDLNYLPTLIDLQNELDIERENSEDGRLMAEGVEYYTRGSMDIFAHHTNVAYQNRFVVFNIRDLGDQLRQIALIIIFDFIWNRMVENKNKKIRTYCYCDEIHVMFATYYSAYFLKQLYKRGRKYGLVITGITQNIEDLLKSDMARGMIGNSDFILMLNQSPEDLKILAKMLSISEAQMGYVSRADAGSGLLFAENTIVPFVDRFPKDSYLYTLMSTRFGEDESKENIEEFIAKAMEEKTIEVPPTQDEIDRQFSSNLI